MGEQNGHLSISFVSNIPQSVREQPDKSNVAGVFLENAVLKNRAAVCLQV